MTGEEPRRAPNRELLQQQHQFPGEYIVKAFGPGSAEFRAATLACAVDVVGADRVATSERATRSGHKICVTLTLHAHDVDEVIRVYERLHGVDDLMLLL